MALMHEGCGGELELDRAYHPHYLYHEGKTDVIQGVRCAKCGEHLGTVTNATEVQRVETSNRPH